MPVLIKGSTGCGKTRFVEHMAAELGGPLYTVACHDDLSGADLVGRSLTGEGGTYWQDGPFTRAVRNGASCYLGEVIEARRDTAVVMHPLTDIKRIPPTDHTAEGLKAPAEFMLVVSYSPGFQSLLKGMKPSTRQRFVSLQFGYPEPSVEREVVVQESGVSSAMASQLIGLAAVLRALEGLDVEVSASIHLLVHAGLLIEGGFDPLEACRAALIEPLSDDSDPITALMGVVQAKMGWVDCPAPEIRG